MNCCERPNVTTMDYAKRNADDGWTEYRNSMCLRCGRHWHGLPGEVKEYTRKEWERFVNDMEAM